MTFDRRWPPSVGLNRHALYTAGWPGAILPTNLPTTLPMSTPTTTAIRTATEADRPSIRALFDAGMQEGEVRINDTGADIEHITEGYLSDLEHNGFWVAVTNDDTVAGMVGVQRVDESVAEIRRLRVHPQWRRRGIGTALMQHAVRFCRDREFLKVVLDVRGERSGAIQLFEKFGFYLAKIREQDERRLLDFYVDLYAEPEA
jgi:GNAT superfamily N-acetyltransferase